MRSVEYEPFRSNRQRSIIFTAFRFASVSPASLPTEPPWQRGDGRRQAGGMILCRCCRTSQPPRALADTLLPAVAAEIRRCPGPGARLPPKGRPVHCTARSARSEASVVRPEAFKVLRACRRCDCWQRSYCSLSPPILRIRSENLTRPWRASRDRCRSTGICCALPTPCGLGPPTARAARERVGTVGQ